MFLTGLKTKRQRDAFLSVALAIAKADQGVHKREAVLLAQYRRELGLEGGYTPPPLVVAKALGVFTDRRLQRSVFLEWLALARADGSVGKGEASILTAVMEAFSIGAAEAKASSRWLVSLDTVYRKGLKLIEG